MVGMIHGPLIQWLPSKRKFSAQQDLLDLAHYSNLNATTSPLTLYIDKTTGSMRVAYPEKYDSLMTFNPLQIMQPTLKCTDLVHSSSMNSKTSLQKIQIPSCPSQETSTYPIKYISWRLLTNY
ncbi:hypothetical protein VP01_5762g1 [Puccinia sorghi]|uniref:Uncharacterized protein n=1 Tax=Puccinia sorghi TaxID=27349 RepID=A0A0L6UIE1_9BASI|nr:hypothetical protein VP01_5762g1 [Puccinia sorghi]